MRLRSHGSIAEITELQRQIIHFFAHQGGGVLQHDALGTGFCTWLVSRQSFLFDGECGVRLR